VETACWRRSCPEGAPDPEGNSGNSALHDQKTVGGSLIYFYRKDNHVADGAKMAVSNEIKALNDYLEGLSCRKGRRATGPGSGLSSSF
jgi:hypothetical protein